MKKSLFFEIKDAAEQVIDVALHPNRPAGLSVGDRLKCHRLRQAINALHPHQPAPWAPRVPKKVQELPDQGATIF